MHRLTYLSFLLTVPMMSYSANNLGSQMQQAGALSQQINTEHQDYHLSKPSEQLFNNPVKIHKQRSNSALRFELKNIEIKELTNDGLRDCTLVDSKSCLTEKLSQIIVKYLHRPIGLDDLNQITDQITQYYRDNDYLVARAFLPPQQIDNGHLVIGLLKGKIGQININNQSRLSENFVKRMANTSVNSLPYLAQTEVEKLSLLLNDIPSVSPSLSITAGQKQGETALNILLKDSKNWHTYIFGDNAGTKETGTYRIGSGVKLFNLAGIGDELSLDLLGTHNLNLKSVRLDYSGLLDGYGSRLGGFASYLGYKLGKDFAALNAKGESQTVGLYLRHPSIRKAGFRMDTLFTLSYANVKDSQVVNQKVENISKQTKAIIGVNGVWNSVPRGTTYFTASVTFGKEKNSSTEKFYNRPIDWKENTRFSLFNLDIGHEQALVHSFALSLNMKAQMSDRNISSSQKMLLGGSSGVRGYRSGAVSVADGFVGQLSLKHYKPLFKDSLLTSSVFYDIGTGKKYHDIDGYSQRPEKTNKVNLQGIGFGLQLSSPNNYSVNLTYGRVIGSKLAGERKQQLAISLVKLF